MSEMTSIMDGIRRGEKEIVGHWLDILIPLALLAVFLLVPSLRPWALWALAGGMLWLCLRVAVESAFRKVDWHGLSPDWRDLFAGVAVVAVAALMWSLGEWAAVVAPVGAVGAVVCLRRLR